MQFNFEEPKEDKALIYMVKKKFMDFERDNELLTCANVNQFE